MIRKYNEDIEEELEQIKERVIEEVKYMLQTEELEAYKLKTIAEIYDILS